MEKSKNILIKYTKSFYYIENKINILIDTFAAFDIGISALRARRAVEDINLRKYAFITISSRIGRFLCHLATSLRS